MFAFYFILFILFKMVWVAIDSFVNNAKVLDKIPVNGVDFLFKMNVRAGTLYWDVNSVE